MADILPPVGATGAIFSPAPDDAKTIYNRALPTTLAPPGISNPYPYKAIGEPFEALVFIQADTLRGLKYGA